MYILKRHSIFRYLLFPNCTLTVLQTFTMFDWPGFTFGPGSNPVPWNQYSLWSLRNLCSEWSKSLSKKLSDNTGCHPTPSSEIKQENDQLKQCKFTTKTAFRWNAAQITQTEQIWGPLILIFPRFTSCLTPADLLMATLMVCHVPYMLKRGKMLEFKWLVYCSAHSCATHSATTTRLIY